MVDSGETVAELVADMAAEEVVGRVVELAARLVGCMAVGLGH